MASLSRLIVGIVLIVFGIGFFVASFFSSFVFLIYATPVLILGIFILFNKKEDMIEGRKDIGKRNSVNKVFSRKDIKVRKAKK